MAASPLDRQFFETHFGAPARKGPAPSPETRSRPLYEIVDHLTALFDTVDLVEDPTQQASIEAEISEYLEAEIRKVDGVAGYLAHCEAQQEFAAAEIRRLEQRKAQWERKEMRLKEHVIATMELNRLRKLEGRTSTLSLRPCPASVKVLDENQVPAEFRVSKEVWSLDKRAMKAAIKAKRDVPGARLITGRNTLVRT